MLVLRREVGQSIRIGPEILLQVVATHHGSVELAVVPSLDGTEVNRGGAPVVRQKTVRKGNRK